MEKRKHHVRVIPPMSNPALQRIFNEIGPGFGLEAAIEMAQSEFPGENVEKEMRAARAIDVHLGQMFLYMRGINAPLGIGQTISHQGNRWRIIAMDLQWFPDCAITRIFVTLDQPLF